MPLPSAIWDKIRSEGSSEVVQTLYLDEVQDDWIPAGHRGRTLFHLVSATRFSSETYNVRKLTQHLVMDVTAGSVSQGLWFLATWGTSLRSLMLNTNRHVYQEQTGRLMQISEALFTWLLCDREAEGLLLTTDLQDLSGGFGVVACRHLVQQLVHPALCGASTALHKVLYAGS